MLLFDSHCHLTSERFSGDLDGVLSRAREAGVRRIVTVGAGGGTESAGHALALARDQAPFVTATAGIHPHDARMSGDAALEQIERHAADPLVVAVGETGLDFWYDNSPRDDQERSFREHVRLARRVGKPLVIHTRQAPERTLAILSEERASEVGGIIHCFSEDARFAARALALGFVSSFSGIVSFPSASAVLDASVRQPLDALLVETDAPFLAPVPHRGRRNEPAYVARVVEAIAAARGMEPDELAAVTTANACRLYGIEPPRP